MKNIVFNDYTGDINELILATADHEGTDVEKFAYEIDWFYQNSGGVYDTYIGDVGVGGERVPAKIAGLAAWVDAYTAPESIDGDGGVKTIRCKKTNNQLVAPDIVAKTSTLRPVYDAVNKKIVFTDTNSQKLSKDRFFTAEPFKSATKGGEQAFTIVCVSNSHVSWHAGNSMCISQYLDGFRCGGGPSVGGRFRINANTSKQITSLIKPLATNPLRLFDTWDTASPYSTEAFSPVPIYYINETKTTVLSNASTVPESGGTTTGTTGILCIGSAITAYASLELHEFLLFDRAISEADLLLLIAHLKAKWGIA